MKKIVKLFLTLIVIFIIVKIFIFLTDIITHKKEIEKTEQIKENITETEGYIFIQAVEDYCSLELIKGRPIPDRITNPKEILLNGKLPRTMDIVLTSDCKATGTFTYGKTTYYYDYKVGKITTK